MKDQMTETIPPEPDTPITAEVVIARLVEAQGNLSDERFVRRWLPGVSATTWLRVREGTYAAKDWSAVLAKLEAGLRGIDDATAARRSAHVRRILPLKAVKQVARAVAQAEHEERDRFVVFLAPTGGGKSKLAQWLGEYYHGRAITAEATECWRDSYLSAILGLADAIGIKDIPTNRRAAEAALIAELRTRPRIIVLDEAHYLGPTSINLVKAVLNRCPQTIVVALAIPDLWARMSKAAWAEADQLRNRAKAIARCEALDPDDIDTFLSDRLGDAWTSLNGHRPEVAASLRKSCQWGLWAEAERIIEDALATVGDRPVTPDDLTAAMRARAGVR